MRLIQTTCALLLCATSLLAQEPPATSVGTRGGQAQAAAVRFAEVLADGRVTFRLLAPKAAEVVVQGNWPGGRGVAMTKDSSGLWSVTTPALQPELWAYTFSVDGVRTLDPRNYNVARDGVGFLNTVLVPGEASAVFQARAVPHGTMTTTWFQSAEVKAARRAIVYTPPGYEESATRYPVLYLLHGSGGDEEAWPTMGAGIAMNVGLKRLDVFLLFLSCGTEDNRIEALTKVEADLRARKIIFTFKRYPGEHEWKVWRHSLVDMAPMLFR